MKIGAHLPGIGARPSEGIHLMRMRHQPGIAAILEKDPENLPRHEELTRLNAYRGKDRDLRLMALCLLRLQIRHFQQRLPLSQMVRTPQQKPYFAHTDFDFSLSHAGDYAVCLASAGRRVGVDLEYMEPAWQHSDSDFFCHAEKELLAQNPAMELFYTLHTRKEALAKAMGLGVFLDFAAYDTSASIVQSPGMTWYLHSMPLIPHYMLSYACDQDAPLTVDEIVL